MPVDTLNAISVFPIKLKQMLPVISLSPAGLGGGPEKGSLSRVRAGSDALLEAEPMARPSLHISHVRLSGISDALPQPVCPS